MAIERQVEALLGEHPSRLEHIYQSDLSTLFRVWRPDGSCLVAKSAPAAAREARMLKELRNAGAAVPQVFAISPGLFLMEDLGPAGALRSPKDWLALADVLATLHSARGAQYGWSESHAFAAVDIINEESGDWAEFWAAHRLRGPARPLPRELRRRIEDLADRATEFLPRTPEPALLHGDLWVGNVVIQAAGQAVLIDPACYYGDRHVDLAMLDLFGSPPTEFWEASGPLDPDWPKLRAAYQLWPAIVHFRLFGDSYRGLVERCLTDLGG